MKIPVFLMAVNDNVSEFRAFWQYLIDFYVKNKTDYELLDFGGVVSVQVLILGLFAVLAIVGVASILLKKIKADFVSALISEECLSSENAKTLPELNFADKLYVRYAVKKGTDLRRVVLCREEEEYNRECEEKAEEYAKMREENPKLPKYFSPKPFKIDPDTHHFYIPEDKKYAAEVRFEQKGNALMKAVILGAVAFAVWIALVIFLPDLLGMLDEFLVKYLM